MLQHRIEMIIGLLGRARCGKDTVANLIRINSAVPFEIVRFAQPIKDAVCSLYGISPEHVETNKKEEVLANYGITPRQAMQEITDYYMRKHGHDFFSARVFQNVATKNIIIPDVRFKRDTEEIKRCKGIVLKIIRPDNTTFYTCEHTVDTCPSDFTIINDGSLTDLEDKVMDIINRISHRLLPE